jgi:hypothetical protein
VFDAPINVTAGNTYYIKFCALAGVGSFSMGKSSSNLSASLALDVSWSGTCANQAFDFWTRTYTSVIETCTDWTYTDWTDCVDSLQTREIATSTPAGCSGGAPVIERSCTMPLAGAGIDVATMSLGLFPVVITFVTMLFASVWPFVLVVVIVSGFAFSLFRFLNKIINKNG